jgi:hypothetical protein
MNVTISVLQEILLATLVIAMARGSYASQEGLLPISRFRLDSDGMGRSDKITVEGKQDAKARLIQLKVKAFGKRFVVPPSQLGSLDRLCANGIRLSYESGYEDLGGRTLYIQLQMGSTSRTLQTALFTLTEDGKIELGRIQNGAPSEAHGDDRIQAEATVIEFVSQALRETYTDGRWAVFDAVELRLTAPPEWRGAKFVVHCSPGNTNVLLQTPGTRCAFRIAQQYLPAQSVNPDAEAPASHQVFDGAIESLRLAPYSTPDYTRDKSSTCEIHQVPMTKRAVPFAHGMIPDNRRAAEQGEWKRRTTLYPHPGDCEPATDLVLPYQKDLVIVFTCPECRRAKRQTEATKP